MTERRDEAQPEPGDVTPDAPGEAPVDAGDQATVDAEGEAPVHAVAAATPDVSGATQQSATSPEPTAEELEHARPARVRHAPRFGRFIGTAVGVGLLIGLVLAIVIPPPQGVGFFLAWAYLGLPIAFFLALVTGIVAVVLDRRS
ncbi:MAG TPA: hypothetical protein VFX33_01315 [Actinomycetales bacterium]|nr:hypothetical protein [Actinomycetales bacterium]